MRRRVATNRGFSLVEVLVSLAILSVGILGFLNVDRISQQWLNNLRDQHDERILINHSYEIVQQALLTGMPCSLCRSITDEFHERFPESTLTVSALSPHSANINICRENEACQRVFVQA